MVMQSLKLKFIMNSQYYLFLAVIYMYCSISVRLYYYTHYIQYNIGTIMLSIIFTIYIMHRLYVQEYIQQHACSNSFINVIIMQSSCIKVHLCNYMLVWSPCIHIDTCILSMHAYRYSDIHSHYA